VWSSGEKNSWNNSVFIVVGVVCALLVVLLMAVLYLLRIRQKKGRWSTFFLPRVCPGLFFLEGVATRCLGHQ
jgi:hypothetical protein